MTMLAAGQAVEIFSAVTRALQPGMLMSSNTTSGRSSRASFNASSPEDASPAIARPGSDARECTTPCLKSGWSSTTRTLIDSPMFHPLHLHRQAHADQGALPRRRLQLE